MTAALSLTERIAGNRLYEVTPTSAQLTAARAQLALLADLYYREAVDADEPERWLSTYSPLPVGDALKVFGRLVNVAADLDRLDLADMAEVDRGEVRRTFVADHDELLAEIVPGGGR